MERSITGTAEKVASMQQRLALLQPTWIPSPSEPHLEPASTTEEVPSAEPAYANGERFLERSAGGYQARGANRSWPRVTFKRHRGCYEYQSYPSVAPRRDGNVASTSFEVWLRPTNGCWGRIIHLWHARADMNMPVLPGQRVAAKYAIRKGSQCVNYRARDAVSRLNCWSISN